MAEARTFNPGLEPVGFPEDFKIVYPYCWESIAVVGAAALVASSEILLPQPMMQVEPIRHRSMTTTRVLVNVFAPRHSLKKIPQSVLKMIMLAICSVQLENL